MKINEEQKVVVWCNQSGNDLSQTILSASFISKFLKKELCLFGCYRSLKEKKRVSDVINRETDQFSKTFPDIRCSELLLEGDLKQVIADLSDKYEAILFCCPEIIDNKILRAFYKSHIPFFFPKGVNLIPTECKSLIIPVDYRQVCKEAALWGSYFGRLNNSKITLLMPQDDGDKDIKNKVIQNKNSIVELFGKFKFEYEIKQGKHSCWKIHHEAITIAQSSEIVVFPGSFNVSLPDLIIGPFEKRLVNKSKVPVLLINPQHEMCMICD